MTGRSRRHSLFEMVKYIVLPRVYKTLNHPQKESKAFPGICRNKML